MLRPRTDGDARWEEDPNAAPLLLEDGGMFGIEALNFERDHDVIREVTATAKTDGELMLLSVGALEECATRYPRLKGQILSYQAQLTHQFLKGSEQDDSQDAGVRGEPAADDSEHAPAMSVTVSTMSPGRTAMPPVDTLGGATMETRLARLESVQEEMLGMLHRQSQDIHALLKLSTHLEQTS